MYDFARLGPHVTCLLNLNDDVAKIMKYNEENLVFSVQTDWRKN